MQPRGQGRRGPWRDRRREDHRGGFGGRRFEREEYGEEQEKRRGDEDLARSRGESRARVWQRKEVADTPPHPDLEHGGGGSSSHNGEDSQWQAWEEKKDAVPAEQNQSEAKSQQRDAPKTWQGQANNEVPRAVPPVFPCEICGLRNHVTRDCLKMFCEICHTNFHTTFDCTACLPWSYGPELCAAQVEGQSFFHIDEIIDTKIARERASTAMITVTKGTVSAKDVELMFMNLLGADKWKWIARPTSDNTFVLRFPNAKMMMEWCHIKTMLMKNGDAQIRIDPWTSSSGSKGELQQAWFRVTNIPEDQRGILTLGKVAGLMGKIAELDERTRFRGDYVRMKIACRDATKVPKKAEAVLGNSVYDFGFVREILEINQDKNLKKGIKINDEQPPQKKSRPDYGGGNDRNNGQAGGKAVKQDDKFAGKHVMSAPPKMQQHGGLPVDDKMLKDAQRAYVNRSAEDARDRVYIPDNLEDSDSDSDFSENIIIIQKDEGQSSKQMERDHSWMAQITDVVPDKTHSNIENMDVKVMDTTVADDINEKNADQVIANSPEMFLPDDSIILTQDSQPQEEKLDMGGIADSEKALVDTVKQKAVPVLQPVPEANKKGKNALVQASDAEKSKADPAVKEKRRSDRLKKTTTLSTMEKNQMMAQKKNLEGLFLKEDKDVIEDALNKVLIFASKLVDGEKKRKHQDTDEPEDRQTE